MEIDFNYLKEQMSVADVCNILAKYGVAPCKEFQNYVVFPTCCHNLVGGSPKLYYYKSSKSFHCYTECGESFDIFTLIQKMEKLRGNDISIVEAVRRCGFDNFTDTVSSAIKGVREHMNFLYKVRNRVSPQSNLKTINDETLNRFVFDTNVLKIWEKEGISFNTMRKFGISYDPIDNCIIIPVHDDKNRLIGIRGRYLSEDAYAKYKPIEYCGKTLKYPSSEILYGLNMNKNYIKELRRAVIFESEKSVLMADTIYGGKSIAVAVFGQNISLEQVRLLRECDVNEIVIAFDADYKSWTEMDSVRSRYIEIAQRLKPYFVVSIIIDQNREFVGYKDSPIDCGKEPFEKLLNQRIIC